MSKKGISFTHQTVIAKEPPDHMESVCTLKDQQKPRNTTTKHRTNKSPVLKSLIIALKEVYSDLSNWSVSPTRTGNNELRLRGRFWNCSCSTKINMHLHINIIL